MTKKKKSIISDQRFIVLLVIIALSAIFSILCYFHFNPFKHMWQGFLF